MVTTGVVEYSSLSDLLSSISSRILVESWTPFSKQTGKFEVSWSTSEASGFMRKHSFSWTKVMSDLVDSVGDREVFTSTPLVTEVYAEDKRLVHKNFDLFGSS